MVGFLIIVGLLVLAMYLVLKKENFPKRGDKGFSHDPIRPGKTGMASFYTKNSKKIFVRVKNTSNETVPLFSRVIIVTEGDVNEVVPE
jgi:hypothetical protein